MRFDIHMHTTYSNHHFWGKDALNTPQEMVDAAIKRGLSGIAITDHQTVKGSLVAKEYAKKYKHFKVITGIEIKTKAGDLLGLGVTHDIPDNLPLNETIEKIHKQGGLAIAPHPFGEFGLRECLKEKAVKADAIEVFNATSCREFQNRKARQLALKHKKVAVAGSDAHYFKVVGNAGIICHEDPLEAIRKGRVKIFGTYTPLKTITKISLKKFSRSIRERLTHQQNKQL